MNAFEREKVQVSSFKNVIDFNTVWIVVTLIKAQLYLEPVLIDFYLATNANSTGFLIN